MVKKLSVLLVVLAAFVIAGCGQPPTEEINATKAQVDSVMAAGAEKYAPEVAASLKSDMDAAMAEVKVQDAKTFKSYDKAKQMLAAVKSGAEQAVQTVAQKKEETKQNAIAAQAAAQTAVQEAADIMKKAPSGKGTTEDIAALKADVAGMQESMPEVQTLMDGGDYMGALEKATAIEEQAKEVTAEVTSAIEKAKSKKRK